MLNILITFLTFVLIILSIFMVLVVLMQRASTNAGMGSAFGGGAAESAFGAETTNVLVKATRWSMFGFFALAFALYLLYMYKTKPQEVEEGLISIPVSEAPAEPADEPVPAETVTEEAGTPQP